MNRQIKFRWWTGKLMTENLIVNGFVSSALNGKNVMQFTGFKDKNGKEIYEGDIVRQKLIDHMEEEGWFWLYSVVEFEMGCWVLKEIGFDYSNNALYNTLEYYNHLYDECNEFEVCGNIFENPELLTPNLKTPNI